MKFSSFGSKFGGNSSIVNLMEDLGNALRDNPDVIFMGGGNPAHIPAVEQSFQHQLEAVLASAEDRRALFGIYQSPQGDTSFREEIARFLKRQFGWSVSANNIALSNGSQPAFFVLYNLLAGTMPDGNFKTIHLPLTPEYLGYKDVGISENFFSATRPSIKFMEQRLFKYHVDFSQLHVDESCAALCVSRPTNPTGNVLTDDEIAHLDELARRCGIPLIIDGAYGLPFPGIIFNQANCHWNDNTVLVLSLSKLGLPGARTGIVVATEELIHAFANANTIVSLACGNLGPAIASGLLHNDEILHLSQRHIAPFYRQAAEQTVHWLHTALQGLPYYIHKPEGAIFLWLWFKGLPISSRELYQRLKNKGVLVVPGDGFFVGLENDWRHQHECLRLSYAQSPDSVRRGVELIAAEARLAYNQ